MKKSIVIVSLFAAVSLSALGQTPTIDAGGVVNVASYAYADLPSGGIAQGSIFGIFGKNLGPTPYVQASGYPLPTTLSNVSVKVTSGSTTANAILFVVSATQINALLPSSIPTGNATLTVTNNGQTSAPASFKVVASSFGIFSLNQGGSGPGIITNPQGVPFGLTSAANPDDPAVIWGTGLAAVQGNEANGALPGDMPNVPVEIYVGSTKANVSYRGRSGCCAGLDQITFTVPNVAGCRIPVTAKIGNVVSNYTTIAVAPKGTRTCSDPNGPSTADLQKFANNGSASVGAVVLSRTNTTLTVPFLGTVTTSADIGAATFLRYTSAQLDASQNPFGTYTAGSCTVNYYKGTSNAANDPLLPKYLDAGSALTVNGKGGAKSLTKTASNGTITYSGLLSTIGATGSVGYLDAGTFSVSGPGGTEVGGFNTSIAIPSPLNWTNQASITDVTRANGQSITWTGADPNSTVLISGYSATGADANAVGANFVCIAKASDGQFTVPAQVLLAMPPSIMVAGVPTGALLVGSNTTPVSFSASGLDVGYLIGTVYSLKNVNIK